MGEGLRYLLANCELSEDGQETYRLETTWAPRSEAEPSPGSSWVADVVFGMGHHPHEHYVAFHDAMFRKAEMALLLESGELIPCQIVDTEDLSDTGVIWVVSLDQPGDRFIGLYWPLPRPGELPHGS